MSRLSQVQIYLRCSICTQTKSEYVECGKDDREELFSNFWKNEV